MVEAIVLLKLFIETLILVLLILAGMLWTQVENLAWADGRHMRLTVAALVVAHLGHALEISNVVRGEWVETLILLSFFVAGAFWICATYDIAEGRL